MLVTDLIPVAVFAWRMAAHARATRVAAGQHHVYAFLGGLGGGMAMQGITLQWLVGQMNDPQPVSYGLGMVALIVNGLIRSAVVAGCTYLHFRARMARDPDFEERTEPAKPSLEADVREPRDGDHVGPY
jgi:hypothetical protein